MQRISSNKALPAGFGIVLLLFGAIGAGAMFREQGIQAQIGDIVDDALHGVELLSRIGRDIEKERVLVDAHVFESELSEMRQLETEIGRVRTNFADAERVYEAIATAPSEAAAWADLKRDIAAIQSPLDRALAFSRANRDAEAQAVLIGLRAQYNDIDGDVTRLVASNTAVADRASGHVRALVRSSSRFFRALAALGVLLTLGIGGWTTRVVGRREAEQREHAMALEARNRDLDAFAGRVAHDLRGPLNTIGLGVGILSKDAQAPTGTVAILRRGVDQMQQVIGDLLLLSKIDAEPRDASCDPTRVVNDVSAEVTTSLDELKGTVRVSMDPGIVRCGEGLLRQALANLLDNAMKYRRDGVSLHVEITGRAAGQNYEICISDNGLGMSPSEAERAFEPFYRAMRLRQAPGTGLGLAIVKRVVEASGGTVSVKSQLGSGTTFLLCLPLHRAQPTPA